MSMEPARFITLEGIEGVGKTTAATCVAERLRVRRHTVFATREPGGTPLGEGVRALLLDPTNHAMVPMAELLLLFAARAQHLEQFIRPALARGETVVCDRFTDASYAYQGGGRGLSEALIAAAEALVHPDLQPDLTVLLDAPADIALARARSRGPADRFELERVEFFVRVRERYLARAAAEPSRFIIVDAAQSMAAVHERLRQIVDERCA